MKKTISVLFAVICLITAGISVHADDGSMDIRDRVNDPTLEIVTAESLTFYDGSNPNDPTDHPTIGSKIRFSMDLAVPDDVVKQIHGGDTFTLELPNTVKITQNSADFPLVNTDTSGNEEIFAYAKVTTEGKVVITFTDEVVGFSGVTGNFSFSGTFDESNIDQPGDIEIDVPYKDSKKHVYKLYPSGSQSTIEKNGVPDSELNPKSITWDVNINKGYDEHSNVVIKDTLPAGLTLDSIEVYELLINLDGSLKDNPYGTKLVEGTDYTVDGSTVKFDSIDRPYVIRYKTTIDDEVKPFEGGNKAFVNKASFESDSTDEPLTASKSITASFSKLLDKKAINQTEDMRRFDWQVTFNAGKKNLIKPTLKDVFSLNTVIVPGSVKFYNTDGEEIFPAYTLDDSEMATKGTVLFNFNEDIDDTMVIKYSTRLKDGYILTNAETFNNTISYDKYSSTASQTRAQRGIIKSVDRSKIDYVNHTIPWTITLNGYNNEMSNIVVKDTYTNGGLTLLPETLVVYDETTKTTLPTSLYTIVPVLDGEGNEKGFTVTFDPTYKTTSTLRITYLTEYDINKFTSPDASDFRNSSGINWVTDDEDYEINPPAVGPNIGKDVLLNGGKTGEYNAITKEITWSIKINYNGEDYKEAQINDVILGDQKFVPGSLEVREYTVNTNGSTTISTDIVDPSLYEVQVPTEGNGQELIVKFASDTGTKYFVTYRTTLKDTEITTTYTNKAIFKTDKYTRELPAEVSVKNGGKFTTKTGVQDGEFFNWSVALNESQSTIKDAVVTDTPSANQIVDATSLKVYGTKIFANGNYEIDRTKVLTEGEDGDYRLEVVTLDEGGQYFKLHFNKKLDTVYILEYRALLNVTLDDLRVTNEITIEGFETSYTDNGGSKEYGVDVNAMDGSIIGTKRGSLSIKKASDKGDVMANVTFDLYNATGNKVATRSTDANGIITFNSIGYGKYTLKEVSTLPGYVIPDDYLAGIEVTVNDASSAPNVYLELTNKKNVLTIEKVNEAGTILPGSTFKLEYFDGEAWVVKDASLDLKSGSVVLEGYPVGKYRLTELTSATDYVLNTAPQEFSILENDNGQAQDITVEFVNYRGSVEIVKRDTDEALLEGVKFDLYVKTEDGDVKVQSDLTTDVEGRLSVEDLAPGSYYFVETESVDGNIVNETPIPFTIASEHSGKPLTVSLDVMNGKGSVRLQKVDANSNPLIGVLFDVYKEGDTTPVATNLMTDDNGYVTLGSLEPGNYYFKEVATLDNYILNTQQAPFTIPEKADTVTVEVDAGVFVNYMGSIKVNKVSTDKTKLDGAVFELYDSEKKLVSTATSYEGVAMFTSLAPGTYTLKEVTAPKGYMLDGTELTVEIVAEFEGEVAPVELTVENKPVVELPHTGDVSGVLNWAGLFTALLGLLVLLINKKYTTKTK